METVSIRVSHLRSTQEPLSMAINPIVYNNMRRQAKAIFTWYPKERGDMRTIHEENDVLTNEELASQECKTSVPLHSK